MKPFQKEKKKKKFESAFGNMNLTDGELNKYYASMAKTRSEIKNYDKIFSLIENMNDIKSFNTIKKELDKKSQKLNRKSRKQNRNEFTSHLINLDNFKEKINYNEHNTNSEIEFLYNFMNKLKNRNKVFVDRRSSIYSNLSAGKASLRNLPHRESFFGNINTDFQINLNQIDDENEDSNSSKTISSEVKSNKNLETISNNFRKFKIIKKRNLYQNNHIPLYTKTLNPDLFKILTQINKEEKYIEKKQNKDMETIYGKKFYNTMTNFEKRDSNLPKLNSINKKKKKNAYFKDNSKFTYPEVNKIIYKKMGKIDYFEKAKKKLLERYRYEKNEREKARLWAIQQRENEEEESESEKQIVKKSTTIKHSKIEK